MVTVPVPNRVVMLLLSILLAASALAQSFNSSEPQSVSASGDSLSSSEAISSTDTISSTDALSSTTASLSTTTSSSTTRYTPPSSPTSTLPAWESPGAHNVPGTRITFPAAGDYWVADGTGVVGWQWDGAYNNTKGGTYWLYLAHVNVTSKSLTRYILMGVWNARIPADVPGSKAFVYAQLGSPFIPSGRNPPNYRPPAREGYYISWELSQAPGNSPDSTIAVSELFEIKEAGTKENLPKGWQKGYGIKDFQKWNASIANGGKSGAGALTAPLALVVLGVTSSLVF